MEFALGDKEFLVLYEHNDKKSRIDIHDFEGALEEKSEAKISLDLTNEFTITQASWGPLNKTLYISTSIGKILLYSFEQEKIIVQKDVHKKEIMSFTVTNDHTMLVTCSKDGFAKLLHPRTFEIITVFDFDGKPCRTASISPLYES